MLLAFSTIISQAQPRNSSVSPQGTVSLDHFTFLQAAPPETNKQKVENDSEFHDPSLVIFFIGGLAMPPAKNLGARPMAWARLHAVGLGDPVQQVAQPVELIEFPGVLLI